MLIEFRCKNFLSFKDEISLNLTSINSYTEHQTENLIFSNREEINLLKSIAIYGSNGGGKSNLLNALTLFKTLIHDSFRDSLKKDEEREVWESYFKLCTTTVKKPSMFEISFLKEGNIYRYGFEVNDWVINKEWLYKTEKRERLLFERNKQDFKINEKSFKEGKKNKDVNSNVLFISYLAQYNSGESSKVFEFIRDFNVINAINDDHFKHATSKLLEVDEDFKKWLSLALRFLEINSVHIGSNEDELLTKHSMFDENNLLKGFTNFSVEKEESEGTRKLIYLLGAIYDTLKWGKVFFIDEFNSKLHPNLSLKLIRLFHEFNRNNAQFIFTALDPTLLDKDIFRRDQIWFVDRNQFGVSDLYPMSDFKATDGLRSVSDFRKKYLNSDFGAAESIEFTNEFIKYTNKI